ncbi:MAG: indole-3-glycerol phosphate synthase TrpC [Chloroflexi bacterium]|nr:indole-3-glycerol phosphate synthase TrpC [Chloroflexota bacterium]MBM3175541.1 indole-3-glycerol phosphate synthase TrpC [Chloroflexota bacterium]MBM4451242.1 indole-3-glycerol phosphate synthase TrpC [Chloroflexota bacterium]
MTILNQIVSQNLQELEHKKRSLSMVELQRIACEQPLPLDFASAIQGDAIRLIAEVKKASPSKGIIRPDFDAGAIAQIYANNGASAISVLTESRHFQGSLEHLQEVRSALGDRGVPLLRKDFICEPYQVYESRAYGADSLLLIVAILQPGELQELLGLSHELDMSCLVEVHDEAEVEVAMKSGARIIGINNRDLTTFAVDLATTERLRPLIPSDRIVVSESGVKERADIERLNKLGIDAVLIGEALMSASDVAAKMRELL